MSPSLLHLAAELHAARGNPVLWRNTLLAVRDQMRCRSVFDLAADAPLGPDDLAALAGRATHCATYCKDCGDSAGSRPSYCADFAVHMHTAAYAVHKTLQAGLFEHLAPTWVVDRSAQVQEANLPARALVQGGDTLKVVEGRLELVGVGGARALRNALFKVDKSTQLAWNNGNNLSMSLLLRMLPDTNYVAVTALLDAPTPLERAPLLADQLGITLRQSELAAHLLADHTVADAARTMGISRRTANEHLAALQQRTGTVDRKALLALLRRVSQR
jgi:DNA-binding CsgD family transcriptional regulator